MDEFLDVVIRAKDIQTKSVRVIDFRFENTFILQIKFRERVKDFISDKRIGIIFIEFFFRDDTNPRENKIVNTGDKIF